MRRFTALLSAWALCALPGTAAASDPPFKEYEVKAAYLFNFGKFVEWPPRAFEKADSPVTICVLGRDPFGPALDELVSGKTVLDRPVAVRRFAKAPRPSDCHILFLSASERPRQKAILAEVGGRPVLTVGDSEGFFGAGGIMAMRIEEDRIRFDVDLDAARRAGLRLNSQLLKLAGNVRGRQGPAD